MKPYLLDGGGVFLVLLPIVLLVSFVAISFLEAWIMYLFKINRFRKALGQSFIVNLCSFLMGIVINEIKGNSIFDAGYNPGANLFSLWLIYFTVTVVTEGLVMMLLNRKTPWLKLWTCTLVMNICSYIMLYLFVGLP
jgi:hypothetical protein